MRIPTAIPVLHVFDVQNYSVSTLPLVYPWLPDTSRSTVLLEASHREGNACVICLLLVLFPIFQFCIAIDWLCAGWLTLIDSLFTSFNWLQVYHPLPSTLSRLLLIDIYLFHITIYCYLPSHQLSSFPLLSFLLLLCPLLPNLSICQCLSFPSCHLPALQHSQICFSPWSWWNLCLPQSPFSLPPIFALSVLFRGGGERGGILSAPAPPALSSSQEEEQKSWHQAQPRGPQGPELTSEWCAVLSPSLGAAQEVCRSQCSRLSRWEWEKARVKSSYSTRNKTASVCALVW